jgi:hypothetical protein
MSAVKWYRSVSYQRIISLINLMMECGNDPEALRYLEWRAEQIAVQRKAKTLGAVHLFLAGGAMLDYSQRRRTGTGGQAAEGSKPAGEEAAATPAPERLAERIAKRKNARG